MTAVLSLCVFSSQGWSANFDTAMGIAEANVPPGADVACMGNAWTATPDFSTNNPAVIAIMEDLRAGGSFTYGLMNFEDGPDISIYSTTVQGKLPVGFMEITYSQGTSGTGATDMDTYLARDLIYVKTDIEFDSIRSIDMQYGLKVKDNFLKEGDRLFLGLSVSPYAKSKLLFKERLLIKSKSRLLFKSSSIDFMQAKSKGYAVGFGFCYMLPNRIGIGSYYQYSHDKSEETNLWNNMTVKSAGHTDLFRFGASWQMFPLTFIAADYQHIAMEGAHKNQAFVGIEQGIIKDSVYLYGGWAGDGPTTGIGIYLKYGGINVAYMHHAFNDLEPFLGKTQIGMVTIYFYL